MARYIKCETCGQKGELEAPQCSNCGATLMASVRLNGSSEVCLGRVQQVLAGLGYDEEAIARSTSIKNAQVQVTVRGRLLVALCAKLDEVGYEFQCLPPGEPAKPKLTAEVKERRQTTALLFLLLLVSFGAFWLNRPAFHSPTDPSSPRRRGSSKAKVADASVEAGTEAEGTDGVEEGSLAPDSDEGAAE